MRRTIVGAPTGSFAGTPSEGGVLTVRTAEGDLRELRIVGDHTYSALVGCGVGRWFRFECAAPDVGRMADAVVLEFAREV